MHNFVLCGMQFGDEGKGSFVDFLAHKYDANWVIRYNGGSQASHTVTTPDEKIHKFSQLGSGMFNEKTKTFLSQNMVINIETLFRELDVFCETSGQDVEDVLKKIYISRNCLVVTPFHVLLNRLRELSMGDNRRGSVGTGVSEVGYLNWYAHHGKRNKHYSFLTLSLNNIFFEDEYIIRRKLRDIKLFVQVFYEAHKRDIHEYCPYEMLADLVKDINLLLYTEFYENLAHEYYEKARALLNKHNFMKDNLYELRPFISELIENTDNSHAPRIDREQYLKDYTIIYEGSQGLLLDVKYGLRPNTTLLDTTVNHAMRIVDRIKRKHRDMVTEGHINVNKVGVAKAYYTRHGKGVFPTENYKMNLTMYDANQEKTFWNGEIRFGWFDAVLFRYAQRINNVNEVYLSSLDVLEGMGPLKVCNSYQYTGFVDDEFEKLFDYYVDYRNRVIITDIKCTCKNISAYLKNVEPIYIEVEGFMNAVVEDENGKKILSDGCKNYVRTISSVVHLPITLISYGPTRDEKLFI